MGRNLAPKHKKCRRFGIKLCSSVKCPMMRRNYPPGVHGPKGRPKMTGYGEQLAEKQKAKLVYGLLERQFAKYYKQASERPGDAGANLLQQLEMRLDNVVYRLGLAMSRPQARQFVNHALCEVNGKKVDIPSYQVKIGEVIGLRAKSKKMNAFLGLEEKLDKVTPPSWLLLDAKNASGKVLDLPKKEEAENAFDVKAIIEFYSR